MEQDRLAFADCLREAQRLGYAEADPTFDVDGHDTAQKLAILASLAFGTKLDPGAIYVEGISSITPADLDAASELGYRVKLLGVAVKTEAGIEQRVHPTMVPKDSAIAQVMGVTNAVTVDAEGLAPITLVGPGAGGMATASAVVADLADIARGVRTPPFGRPAARMTAVRKAPMQHHEGGYYIRLLARDRPGTAATIARRLAQQKISLELIVQRHGTAARRAAVGPLRRAGAGDHDHLCDQRGRGAQGACRGAPRPCNLRPAASDPDREELGRQLAGRIGREKRWRRLLFRATSMIERILSLEIVRVTERAAVAAARLRGRGDEKKSDQAAVDAMRRELNKLPIDGTVVIGEGEMDEAPMLFIGEKVGTKGGPKVDIAVDPLEGTTLCAKNMPGAIATMAMAEDGTLLHAPDIYMDKIAIGPGYPKGVVDLDAPADENIRNLAKAKGVKPEAITAMILDRPRHADIIAGGAQGRRRGEPDQRRRRRRRHPHRRAGQDRHRHLSRHRRRARRRAGGGGAALHRRPDAGAADHRYRREARARRQDGHQGPAQEIPDRGHGAGRLPVRRHRRHRRPDAGGVQFGNDVIETETVVMRSATGTVRWIRAEHRQLDKF